LIKRQRLTLESRRASVEKAGTAKYMVRSKPMGIVGGEKVLSAEIHIGEASAEPVKTKEHLKESPSGTELTQTPKESEFSFVTEEDTSP